MSSICPASGIDPWIQFSHKEFLECSSNNEKLAKAARMGCFYLEIPEDCRPFLEKAIQFAHSFPQDEKLKERKFANISGYIPRAGMQLESMEILKRTLTVCGIPTNEQKKISCGVTEGKGETYLIFNHYSPEKPFTGVDAHRDTGYVTLLFINQRGLQGSIQDEWVDIPPLENYFITIFGDRLAMSIKDLDRLKPLAHRVESVRANRISLGIFC
jgi:2OG-Fe(II) oxygenase superfamily